MSIVPGILQRVHPGVTSGARPAMLAGGQRERPASQHLGRKRDTDLEGLQS